MADSKDNDYEEEEINPVLMNLLHSKKPSNGIETEAHKQDNKEETGDPLQTKKERINILKQIKNDIDENKKKNEFQERSNESPSLPLPNKRLSDKESIMQRLIEAKKKKMELNEHYQVTSNQEGDKKEKDDEENEEDEVKVSEKRIGSVSNEKIEKLKHLFSSNRDTIEAEAGQRDDENKDKEEEEEEVDNEKNERERIKQKLLKLALEKKKLKDQANLSLSLHKKNSNEDAINKNKCEERSNDFNRKDEDDDKDKDKDEDEDDVKAKERNDKKAFLEKIVRKHKEKQVVKQKNDDDDDEEEDEENKFSNIKEGITQKKEDRIEANKTNELKNIIEMMKNKKKEEEEKRMGRIEESEETNEIEERKAYENKILKQKEDERIKKEKEKEKEKERIRQEEMEIEREKEKQRKERLEKERLEKERLEREKQRKERLVRERLERERLEREKQERERLETERLERQRLETERLERERLETERLERQRLETERIEREKQEREKQERERLEREILERLQKEKLEREKLERERLERERLERERLERERLEREKRKKEELVRKEENLKKLLEQEQQKKKERQEREFKEQLIQNEIKQKEQQKQKQFDAEKEIMKQNEIKLQKEIKHLKELVLQREIESQKEFKRRQDIEYQKELEFQKQLEKETQKQLEKETQKQSFTTQKTKSSIENFSYMEEDEPKGVSNQCHSSKLIYNPKKPGLRGKSVDKPQDVSTITNSKSPFNSNCYSLVSSYINDTSNQETEKPLNTNGNNSTINLLSNYSAIGDSSSSSVYSKAPIYNRTPRRFANSNASNVIPNSKPNLIKSPTASYVSSQYNQPPQLVYPIPQPQMHYQTPQPSQLAKRDESELSINLEDLLLLEEKLSDIIISLNADKPMSIDCFEWWNFFFNCSLFNRIEKTFNDEYSRKIIQASNNIELLSIIICYNISFDKTSLSTIYIMLKTILNLNHRNFMVICEHILSKISKDSLNNLWVFKLRNVINSNINKNADENFTKFFADSTSDGAKYISEIKYNSSCISDYIRIILKNYNHSKVIESLVSLFKNIQKKTYEDINAFFREKIMRVENRNASVLASVLIRDNFKFLSVPTPYLESHNLKKLTLVLDLDETLIHFKVNPNDESQGVLLERPGILDFLETVGNYYELIVFTAAIQDYADPIINAIEEKRLYFDYRLYRQHAVIIDNDFVKDLSRLGRPIDKMIIVDNMPQNFRLQKENGIFIRAFWGEDQYDTALIDLMPILINIAFEGGDVRYGLSKYKEEIVRKVSSNISKNNK